MHHPMDSQPDQLQLSNADPDLEQEVARLMVDALQLEIAPEEIDPEAPLFNAGLGLDSIDALELALAISREYGFELKSDDERNGQIFASLRSLAGHIRAHRTR
jgi:acyl carrier protein